VALDTRTKRASNMLLALPFRPTLPIPDGTLDQADRQQFLYMGNGQLFQTPSVLTPTNLGYLTFDIGGGLSKTFLPSGNTTPVVVETIAPVSAPPNDKGVIYTASGGVVTVHVWDGTQWLSRVL